MKEALYCWQIAAASLSLMLLLPTRDHAQGSRYHSSQHSACLSELQTLMPPTRSAHTEQGEGAGLLQGSLTSLCVAEAHLAAAQSLQQSPHKQDGCVQGALRQHAGRCSVLAASCQLQLLEDDQATLALQACSCIVMSLLQCESCEEPSWDSDDVRFLLLQIHVKLLGRLRACSTVAGNGWTEPLAPSFALAQGLSSAP